MKRGLVRATISLASLRRSVLRAMEDIIAELAYPSIVMLFTGLLLNVLHRKNGGNCAADLADLKEFVRGVRLEIRLQGGSNGAR